MKKIEVTCDCGCKMKTASANGWFVLRQKSNAGSDHAKLRRKFHFSSLDCLQRWTGRVVSIAKSLEESARNTESVRGQFEQKNAPGIYV